MQLIKSFFCWQGFDNRQRFILIVLSSLLVFITLSASLSNFKLVSCVILFLCSLICLATTKRRQNDAQFDKKWLMAPAGSLLITGLIIVFVDYGLSYWLLILPTCLSLLLLTYPSNKQRHYVLGYNGPVNLSNLQKTTKTHSRSTRRVEPTMNNIDVNHANTHVHTDNVEHAKPTNNTTQANANANVNKGLEFAESIRLTLFSKMNTRITIAVIASFFLLILLLSWVFSSTTEVESPVEHNVAPQEIITFQHILSFPDKFSVMFDADDALVIHWQADVLDNSEIWALSKATGDISCKVIEFNNELPIRTYAVSSKDNGLYAYFSPLDTKALLKNIAFKNNFSLCGYKFSLKGSQATLGKSAFYSPLIEY
tara:strand:- start:1100 stop:2206 length:1107 start_codon:yes stop_codon:yes gene_type:complete